MRCKYQILVNGKTVKTGVTVINNFKFAEFEKKATKEYRVNTNDIVEVNWR